MKAKVRIDKDAVIKELNELIEKLKKEMAEKDKMIHSLQSDASPSGQQTVITVTAAEETTENAATPSNKNRKRTESMDVIGREQSLSPPGLSIVNSNSVHMDRVKSMEEQQAREEQVFERINTLRSQYSDMVEEEAKWIAPLAITKSQATEQEMRAYFDRFDENGDGVFVHFLAVNRCLQPI